MRVIEIDVIYGTGDKPLKYRVHLTAQAKRLLEILAENHIDVTRLNRLFDDGDGK